MRWQSESFETAQARLERWHVWFAWRPVRDGEQLVWLEIVWRRKAYYPGTFPMMNPSYWQYSITEPPSDD